MTKTELLALADEKPTSINDDLYAWATQAAAALREYAGMLDAEPSEFCCESAWRDAKALAWKQRDLNCGCDHNEYCGKCFPLDFRKGGKWDKYTHPPAPTQREHITDGSPCWCSPDLDYVDPETGAKVWIHKESQ